MKVSGVRTYLCSYITNTTVSKDTLLLAVNKGTSTPWLTGILLEMSLNSSPATLLANGSPADG